MRTVPLSTLTAGRRTLASAIVALMLVATAAGRTTGLERRPLPQVVATRADGSQVDLPTLAQDRGWLLLVVAADAPGSQRLLDALESWVAGPRAAQIVVLLQGTKAVVGKAATQWQAKLPGAVILDDSNGTTREAIGVRAIPSVIGLRGAWVEWRIAGVLNDPEMLRAVIVSWLADDRPPA